MKKGFTPLFFPLILLLIITGTIIIFLIPTPEQSQKNTIEKEEKRQEAMAKKIEENDNLAVTNPESSKIKSTIEVIEKSKLLNYVSYTSKKNYTSNTSLTEETIRKFWFHDNKIRNEVPEMGSISVQTPELTTILNKKENKLTKKDTPKLFKTSYFDIKYGYIMLVLTKYLDVKVTNLELNQKTHSYDINFEYTDNSVIDFPEKRLYELKVLENGFCIYQKQINDAGVTIDQTVNYTFEPFSDKLFEIPN